MNERKYSTSKEYFGGRVIFDNSKIGKDSLVCTDINVEEGKYILPEIDGEKVQ